MILCARRLGTAGDKAREFGHHHGVFGKVGHRWAILNDQISVENKSLKTLCWVSMIVMRQPQMFCRTYHNPHNVTAIAPCGVALHAVIVNLLYLASLHPPWNTDHHLGIGDVGSETNALKKVNKNIQQRMQLL